MHSVCSFKILNSENVLLGEQYRQSYAGALIWGIFVHGRDCLNTLLAFSKSFLGNSALMLLQVWRALLIWFNDGSCKACAAIQLGKLYLLLSCVSTCHTYCTIGLLHFPMKIIFLNLTWFWIFWKGPIKFSSGHQLASVNLNKYVR